MRKRDQQRIPITPLLPYITRAGEVQTHPYGETQILVEGKMTQLDLARRIGVSRNTVYRWFKIGLLVDEYETVCALLGKHPIDVVGRRLYMEYFIGDGRKPRTRVPFDRPSLLNDPVLGTELREELSSGNREGAGEVREGTEGSLRRLGLRMAIQEGAA